MSVTRRGPSATKRSIFSGPTSPELLITDLGKLLERQAARFGDREAVVCPGRARLTYNGLNDEASRVAKGLLSLGVRHGDRVGILQGNCHEYITLFFAAGRIGAILVVLNTGYTPDELRRAVAQTEMKVVVTSSHIGLRDNRPNIDMLSKFMGTDKLPALQNLILIRGEGFKSYQQMIHDGTLIFMDTIFRAAQRKVKPSDICNIQFTSGTSGNAKAAQLSHMSIINNGWFIGERMKLREQDIVCSPPPLFHCFGLVLGLLAVITHGAAIVLPSETFNAKITMQTVINEKCTMLHGVPTMFSAYLAEAESISDISSKISLKGGIAAGSSVPRQLMLEIFDKFGMHELTNVYGMTETSPASFMTCDRDSFENRVSTVGKLLPHTIAKVVDPKGDIVPVGVPGELCVSGYLLQAGYWRNHEKTAEAMIRDADGTLWMHTGDEACFDSDGYCKITGRLKDVIIRGGENISPLEIEERLLAHPSITKASVVGLPDARYGESVGAFVKLAEGHKRPKNVELEWWVRDTLAKHKTPRDIFWLGDDGVGADFPQTASGKIQKNILRLIGENILKGGSVKARL